MLKRASNFFYSKSSGWAALTGLTVFILFMIFVLPSQARKAEAVSGGNGSPDTTFFYSTSDLYRMAEAYGAEGRAAYIQARFTFDLIFPIAYFFFLVTWISWLFAKVLSTESRWRLINLFPLFGMAFDYLENICASLVLGRFPAPTPVIDSLAPVFSLVKWFFVNGSFVILLAGLPMFLWRRLKK